MCIALQRLVIDAGQRDIGCCTAPSNAQVLHSVQCKDALRPRWRGNGKEVRPLHVREIERGARVRSSTRQLDMTHLDISDVAQEKTEGRHSSEHSWIRIFVFKLWRWNVGSVNRSTAHSLYINI